MLGGVPVRAGLVARLLRHVCGPGRGARDEEELAELGVGAEHGLVLGELEEVHRVADVVGSKVSVAFIHGRIQRNQTLNCVCERSEWKRKGTIS